MWIYGNSEVYSHEDLHPDCTDIVYILYFESGKRYIGKKTVRSLRRLKPTKKQLAIRKNYVRREIKNLPFIDYEGSSAETVGEVLKSKIIMHQCSSKRTATYMESGWLFEVDAIFNENFLNQNIQGCFFDNALDGLIEEDEDG